MESNELRLGNEPRTKTVKFLREHLQDRMPRNQQRRLKLSCELKNAMQDRQWKSSKIQNDLESIRKFSILNCIRERVFDVLSELPLLSIECLCQQDIDGLIRRNLLRERKVRFNADNEYEGEEKMQKSEEEIQKENILEEMDIVLKVLGNDRRNKLVIENFELLEQRIARVEQRLSGLVRRLPAATVSSEVIQSQIKIDIGHVRMDIQNFVNKFNQVFTSDYELPPGVTEFSQHPRHSLSSTNRLRFQMLQRLPERCPNEEALEWDNNYVDEHSEDTKGNTQITEIIVDATNEQKDVAANVSIEKIDSTANQHVLKAVDSLITLRERFKLQSAKWLLMSRNKNREKQHTEELRQESKDKIEDILLTKIEDLTIEAIEPKALTGSNRNSQVTEIDVQPETQLQSPQDTDQSATVTTLDSITSTVEETVKQLKEITNSIRQNKSVQTAPKKKKKRSKSKMIGKRKNSVQQLVDPKDVWVQYVNRKVLRYSKSNTNFNDEAQEPTLPPPPPPLPPIKPNKESTKQEKNQKKIKQPKHGNSPADIKDNEQASQKAELKKNEQVTTQFKEYKKIFLLKMPKSSSKQANHKDNQPLLPKKMEGNGLAAIKETVQKKLPEKSSKNNSLIRLFPKAFKSKTKQQKSNKEEKTQRPSAEPIIPSDSLQKLNTNQFLNKIRNRWIYGEDQNGDLVQKPIDDWAYAKLPQNHIPKNRKPPQKPKKKKTDAN